jgi:hypothetical protein
MPNFIDNENELLDLEELEEHFEEDDDDASAEELQDQVERAQNELLELKRRQEEIEKEKLRLEDLSRRQEELEQGRLETLDRLNRSLVLVQRELEESQRRLQLLENIREGFTEHVKELEAINPKSWSSRELPRELTKAFGLLEEAQSAYTRNHIKVVAEADEANLQVNLEEGLEETSLLGEQNSSQGFVYWLLSGFAFTLPLLLLGVIALILWMMHS